VHDVDGAARERLVLADWEQDGSYLEASEAGIVAREISGATGA
jgi:hypothetical protein